MSKSQLLAFTGLLSIGVLACGTDSGGGLPLAGKDGSAAGGSTAGSGGDAGVAGAAGGGAGSGGAGMAGTAGAGAGGAGGKGGTAGGTMDGGVSSPCPTSAPEAGSSCGNTGLVCEYGDDPRLSCRTRATCTSAAGKQTWSILSPKCMGLPPTQCPGTRAAADGKTCTPMDAYCGYPDDTVCHCTNCSDRGPAIMCMGDPTWHCDVPNTTPNCPPGMPRLGSACTVPGQACVYGCGEDRGRTCKQGAWTPSSGGPCPVSTRSAKQDIRYLTPADRARLAEDVLALRLARYQYKNQAVGPGERLGFIIEDSPQVPAVEAGGRSIDLYAYTSMLVAAVQEQALELRTLKAELAKLQKRETRKHAAGGKP